MKHPILLKTGSILLLLWGLLNIIGGAFSVSEYTSLLIPILFVIDGVLIVMSSLGFWFDKRWSLLLSLVSLISLSIIALFSAAELHGWSGINISHHITRLLISAIIILTIIFGRKRGSSNKSTAA